MRLADEQSGVIQPCVFCERDQRIGVHDSNSLAECLIVNFQRAFPHYPSTDSQDMIQLLSATVIEQRLKIDSLRKQLGAANLGWA